MSHPAPEAFPDMPMGPRQAPTRRPVPWVCYGYIAVCIALFVLGTFSGLHQNWGFFFGLYAPAVKYGEWWRILSCHFLHGNVLHLAFNMWVAYGLGRGLEASIGHGLFAWASVLGALGTALSCLLFSPEAYMVGASGVIISWAGVMLPLATRHARKGLLIWFAQIAILSLLPGISLPGHAGGAAAGLVCGLALRLSLRGRRAWLFVATAAIALLCAWAAQRGPALPPSVFSL
ncbi:MAG: rhomboid family intramembrane serine protease [Cystobacterineae bacterium]|nr:rhomboid family intramembrane serine protease [Cystobacterineae bacterium]